MHTLVHFLVLILVSSSYDQSNRVVVEARKLSSNVAFTVDLVYRDLPLSMLPREPFGLDNNKNEIDTIIIPTSGSYLMKIALGTPPVEYLAVADTGSNLIWLQCSPCKSCIQQESPLFDPSKSSTYHAIPCNSPSCKCPDLLTGCQLNNINDNGSCIYEADYGDGTTSTGVLTNDAIALASTTFPSFVFGCGYNQEGYLGSNAAGIIGLGAGPLSLVSQLGPNIDYKFSYCLAPLFSGAPSKLNFGLDVSGPGVVSTPFTTQDPPIYYNLNLEGINIGNSSIPVSQDVVLDSGTTLTYLGMSVYNEVKTAVAGSIGLSPVPDPGGVLDLCYKSQQSGVGFSPPAMVFQFKGANLVLEAANTFITLGNVTCLAMLPSDDNSFTFGNIAQANFEVGYDLLAKQVSFAPADCTK